MARARGARPTGPGGDRRPRGHDAWARAADGWPGRAGRLDLAGHQATFGTTPALTQAELISWTREVDLRGRGGAAFPFARKLTAVAEAAQRRRGHPVVVVNATEGEPGSIKDKMLLSRSPYLVLTGALVAAQALGARRIVIGVGAPGPAPGLGGRGGGRRPRAAAAGTGRE